MPRRVDIDETLLAASIPTYILNEMFNHALEAYDEECCGLIIGSERERYARVIRCKNDMTKHHEGDREKFPRSGKRAFWMNEHDYLNASSEAQASGQDVTAVYHSHVNADVYLSEMDLEFAEQPFFPFPKANHIVLSVVRKRVRALGLFQRVDGRFVGRPIEPETP